MSKRRKQPPTVGFVALGCAKNTVDSERMLAEIAQSGLLIVGEPETPEDWQADVVVVNTCGFIAPAVSESLDVVRQIAACKVTGNVGKVIITGCVAQRFGAELFEMVDGIDAIVGLNHRDDIASIIKEIMSSREPRCYLEGEPTFVSDDRTRLRINPGHWAYLRISEGCDHSCAFCTIPSIRGRFRSKPADMIISEANELASSGVVELNIIGQDTTYYGYDLKSHNALANLLRQLDKIDQLKWIRLLYAYPTGITDELIEVMAKSSKIVQYLDIPLQHINNKVLKDMRRPDTKEQIMSLIERLRSAMSDIVLRTTLIVGFPGETDEQFDELMEFIEWAKFDALGCFKFYPESGTKAAQMDGQIAEAIKDQRLEALMLAQQDIAFKKNLARKGSVVECLVDWTDHDGTGVGRFYGQAPEVDGECTITKCSAEVGEVVNVKVVGIEEYDLIVEQI